MSSKTETVNVRAVYRQESAFSPLGSRIKAVLARVKASIRSQIEHHSNRKAIGQLLRLDDRMLKDIGVTRPDIVRASFSDDPAQALAKLDRIRKVNRYR